jgi:hypothetical protein
METAVISSKRNREVHKVESALVEKRISEEDIRRRAYEIYLENGDSYSDELDDWYRAERELRGED